MILSFILSFYMLLIPTLHNSSNEISFDEYFINKTMRIDYFHIGDAKVEEIVIDYIYQQGIWAGSIHNLIDTFGIGSYEVKVFDEDSSKLIFSKGFNSYFGEYKTTNDAINGIKRAYHESLLIPYPKSRIKVEIESRDRENALKPLFRRVVDPSNIDIVQEKLQAGTTVYEIQNKADHHQKVDIAFIAEGYTQEEESKFRSDVERFTGVFFSHEPFESNREHFNVYGVFKASTESGCDEPRQKNYKKTILNSSFNALGLERYLLTEDNKSLRDIAAHVPYDTLVIMVNSKRYGGGGIYNFYSICTVDNDLTDHVFLHEFGHSFAGLADEYYASTVAYNEFYPKGVEPLEPNITALLNPKNVKWKELLHPGIAIPTPWQKKVYDRMNQEFQKKRAECRAKIIQLKKNGATQEEIEKVKQLLVQLEKKHKKDINDFFTNNPFKDKVGVFEGAGYSSEGLYRPMLDCIMFRTGVMSYCRVCERAVIRTIEHYTQ
ncbi:MAG: M64 family metallopeptidase [Acidobacteriota bacterium]|nr:M64 family metallopeptidase [Acidobacteriota bacterium]